MRALAPPPGRVLDLGCGSGEPIARYFVEKGHRVTGVDLVEGMLAIGRARFPGATWLRADMRGLELPERFEIVSGTLQALAGRRSMAAR